MAMAMSSSSSFLVVLVSVLLAHNAATGDGGINGTPPDDDFVHRACVNATKAAAYGRTNFTADLCVRALQSDSRTAVAKSCGELVGIGVDVLTARAAAAREKLEHMVLVDGSYDMRVRFCLAQYGAVWRDYLPVCRRGLLDPPAYGDMGWCLERSGFAAFMCDAAFRWQYGYAGEMTPLRWEDFGVITLTDVVYVLVKCCTPNVDFIALIN